MLIQFAPALCEGIEEMIQQREYQCDEEAVPHRPHRRIGFVPKPKRAGGVDHEESDEPEQGLYEEAGESFLGSHKIRGFKVLQRFTVCRKIAYRRNLAQ